MRSFFLQFRAFRDSTGSMKTSITALSLLLSRNPHNPLGNRGAAEKQAARIGCIFLCRYAYCKSNCQIIGKEIFPKSSGQRYGSFTYALFSCFTKSCVRPDVFRGKKRRRTWGKGYVLKTRTYPLVSFEKFEQDPLTNCSQTKVFLVRLSVRPFPPFLVTLSFSLSVLPLKLALSPQL